MKTFQTLALIFATVTLPLKSSAQLNLPGPPDKNPDIEVVDPYPQARPKLKVIEPTKAPAKPSSDYAKILDSGMIDVTANPQTTWHGQITVGDDKYDHQLIGFVEFDLSPFKGRKIARAVLDTGPCSTTGIPQWIRPFHLVLPKLGNQTLPDTNDCGKQYEVTNFVVSSLPSGIFRLNIALNGIRNDKKPDQVAFTNPWLVVEHAP
jgi:hypothetical protein